MSLFDPMGCGPPGSSVHGILQARMLEWAALPFSRGPSRPGDQASSLLCPASASAGRFSRHQCHLGSLVGLFWTQRPRRDDVKAGPRSGWIRTLPVSPLALCSPRLSQNSCRGPEAGAGPAAEAQLSPTTKMPIISASAPPFHVG